jgi:hypothetical protein
MVNDFQKCSIVYGLTLVCGHCVSNKNINGRPSTHSPQNASAVQLGVSQPIFGAAVICRPPHWRPFLPFVLSANNCRSEHIHRMLLSDVAVTTEQLPVKYMGLILAKWFMLNVCHLSCYRILKISKFLILARLYILDLYVRELHFGIREKFIWVKCIQYFLLNMSLTII